MPVRKTSNARLNGAIQICEIVSARHRSGYPALVHCPGLSVAPKRFRRMEAPTTQVTSRFFPKTGVTSSSKPTTSSSRARSSPIHRGQQPWDSSLAAPFGSVRLHPSEVRIMEFRLGSFSNREEKYMSTTPRVSAPGPTVSAIEETPEMNALRMKLLSRAPDVIVTLSNA